MAALDVKNVMSSIKIPALIKAIEKYPTIWNKSSPDYMKKCKQRPSWFEVCDKVIPDWKFIPAQMKLYFVAEVRKKWRNIKDYYYRKNQREKEGTSKSTYMYNNLLSFLSTIEVGEGDNKPEPIDEDDSDDANGEVSGEDLSAYDCEHADVIPEQISIGETLTPAAVALSPSGLTVESLVKSLKLPTFVHAIKKHPVIWNKRPADKSTATHFNERADAWNSICKELIPNWERKSKDDKAKYIIQIKKKWKNVWDYYRRNRIDADPEYKGAHSELLSFLKPLYTNDPNKTDEGDDEGDAEGEVPDEDLSAYDCEYADVIPHQISISETLTPAAVASTPSGLTIEELVKSMKVATFVHAIKNHPVIWNKRPADKLASGTLLNGRTDAWNSIGKEIIPNWEEKTKRDKLKYIIQMKKKWGNLRSYYKLNTIDTLSKYKYSDLLAFMKPLYIDDPNKIGEDDGDHTNGEMSDEDLSAYDCEYADVIPEEDSGSGSQMTPTLEAVAPFSSQLTIGILVKSLKSLPLVRAIKKHPVIWKDPPENKPKPVVWEERKEAYDRICKELIPNWGDVSNEYLKSRYIHQIKKKWGNVRTYYRKHIMKKCIEKSPEHQHAQLWSVMKPLLTDNPKEIDEDDANGEVSDEDLSAYDCEYADVIPEEDSGSGSQMTPTLAAVAPFASQLTIGILVKSLKMPTFVHAIKKHPVIWNKMPAGEPRVALLHERKDAWNSVCKELFPNWEGVSEDDKSKYLCKLKKKWGGLRDYYRKHKSNLDKYENSELFSFLRPLYADNPKKTGSYDVMDEDTAFEIEYLEDMDDTIEDQSVNSIKHEPEDPIETPFTPEVVEPAAKKFRAEMSEQGSFIEEPSSISQAEDADLTFFRSFLPDIKMLNSDQKFDFKLGIMKLLKKIKNKQVVNDSDSE